MGHDNIHMYTQAKTCKLCGKTFYCSVTDWVYKIDSGAWPVKFFCSWSCIQKYRKLHKEKTNNAD